MLEQMTEADLLAPPTGGPCGCCTIQDGDRREPWSYVRCNSCMHCPVNGPCGLRFSPGALAQRNVGQEHPMFERFTRGS